MDILQYSRVSFGERQQELYADALHTALESLRENPALGHHRPDIPANYRAYQANKHHIIYRYTAETVYVARVLHHRMDIARHVL